MLLEGWLAAHGVGSGCSALHDLQDRWRLLCHTVKYCQIKHVPPCNWRVSTLSFCGYFLELRTLTTLFAACPGVWFKTVPVEDLPDFSGPGEGWLSVGRRGAGSQCSSLWVVKMLLVLSRLCFLTHCYGLAVKNLVSNEAILWQCWVVLSTSRSESWWELVSSLGMEGKSEKSYAVCMRPCVASLKKMARIVAWSSVGSPVSCLTILPLSFANTPPWGTSSWHDTSLTSYERQHHAIWIPTSKIMR